MYNFENKKIVLPKSNSFKISETLECGQCFRFEKLGEEKYTVVAFGKLLLLEENSDGSVTIYGADENDYKNIWENYFDFVTDYDSMKEYLAEKDDILKNAIDYAPGIRILNQEFFECLISFIISQNNRIPMIKKVIKNISEKYGKFICEYEGEKYYAFPTPDELSVADEEGLMSCKTGFRAKYIIDAVSKVRSGEIDFDKLKDLSYDDVKKTLMTIKGVGPKVADCVTLFSCGKRSAFPVDVWVKRIMYHFYFNGEDVGVNEIHRIADEKFGEYAGFAQQYLFNYARQFQIGK
ncbi:MAG: DNA-3-methyladenine glycosylase 2 family protein [Tyzzerella sp.]|uniref:DNA-(apurinic or apyrimidinic site) lyase n=1 Tax=Candidatus Fimicola merdigallinarum TaxID=2840819 RepID=A0A9D9DWN2_9FIRM|nr:DNA-3-methyladenine glycosylase 2 family protein [Candidatus Fimicola merdigallinarum]